MITHDPKVDQDRLIQHFESLGMVPVEETYFMVASPSTLGTPLNQAWYPGLLED